MNDNPIVSICCITYNHAPFIRECLDGFLMQETTFPVEILIHDDASTDGTDDIIREYTAKFPDKIFPLYEEENKFSNGYAGKMDLFNYERAKGKYIAYCEGDDHWTDPLKLQKQVDFMETHPEYSVCFHNCHYYDVRLGKVIYPRFYKYIKDEREGVDVTIDDYFHRNMIIPLTMLFRLSMYSFDWRKQYKYFRDTYEIYHLLKAGKGYWMKFDGGVYTRHGGGVSTSASVEQHCWEERENIKDLYLHNHDEVLGNYLEEILLWNYDVFSRKKQVGSFHKIMRDNFREVPYVVIKVYTKIMIRKAKKLLANR